MWSALRSSSPPPRHARLHRRDINGADDSRYLSAAAGPGAMIPLHHHEEELLEEDGTTTSSYDNARRQGSARSSSGRSAGGHQAVTFDCASSGEVRKLWERHS